MDSVRQRLEAALAKPLPEAPDMIHAEVFDPWEDVIDGVLGSYSSESDDLMIGALEAMRDMKTFEFIDAKGFAGEFALYVIAGHRLMEYGTSPRGGWPDPEVSDLWQQLIDKWKGYAAVMWS